ncbi:hypothetical protein JCM15765_25560 [Paradesulfitobacterium aromaticivorans]
MNQSIEQYSLYWVDLNPTKGAEINKTRPCVVISPLEMNEHLRTIIIAPVTSRGREGYPARVGKGLRSSSSGVFLFLPEGVWYFPEFVEKHKKPGHIKVAGFHTLIALIRPVR